MKKILLITILVIWAGLNCASFAQSTGTNGDKVTVINNRVKNGIELVAHNKYAHSVTLSLEVSGVNYKVDRPVPLTTVLIAGESRKVLTVLIDDTSKSFSLNNNYTWFAGDIYAIHDDSFKYRLPFETGARYMVGQSYNGTFSHQGRGKYAVDFIMPEGSNVVAARGGVVTMIKSDSDKGGSSSYYKRDSNFIVIEHSDGTLGEYAHLKKGGVLVKPGDRITKGQVIGLSGNTGYSSGPHLHFMVSKVLPDGHSQSLPVQFETDRGTLRELKKGVSYTAL